MTYSAFSPLCASVSHRIGCFLPDFFSLFFFFKCHGAIAPLPSQNVLVRQGGCRTSEVALVCALDSCGGLSCSHSTPSEILSMNIFEFQYYDDAIHSNA